MRTGLYDQIKNRPVERIPDDLTTEDIRGFCDAHDVSFHAMGTPPGKSDPDGLGWDDPNRFRVSTRPGMLGGNPRGVTVKLDDVRTWRIGSLSLDASSISSIERLTQAAALADSASSAMRLAVLEQSLRVAFHLLDDNSRRLFAGSEAYLRTVDEIDARWRLDSPIEDASAGARVLGDPDLVAERLLELLNAAILAMHPRARPAFFARPEIQERISLAEQASPPSP